MLIFMKTFRATIIGIAISLATVLQAQNMSSDWTLAKNSIKYRENTVILNQNS